MKKFKFIIRGNNYDVDILNMEDDVAEIEVNGTTYQVEVIKQKKETKTPKLVRTTVVPSAEADKAKTSKPTESKGAGHIKAPLPGVILEVKTREGDIVKIGDTLLILQAMKMENNIKADKEGKILSLKVKPGDSVLEGDVLAEIGG
ncbi:MAG: biotin/lipoyl-binding protein [Melioribacteraceae bacterium]|nr:MAG: biotin/lipoyl-binding protein [Melioribacteraceae bacterium]